MPTCRSAIIVAILMLMSGTVLAGEPTKGYSAAEVAERLSELPLAPIEGLWRLVPDGATIAIERGDGADRYTMKVVESAARSVRQGTTIGEIKAGADASVFEARIYTRRSGSHFYMPRKFTLTLDGKEGRLEFRKHRSPLKISLWHFVPFLWRYSVRMNGNEREYMPGAVRLYPSPAKPLEPVYL